MAEGSITFPMGVDILDNGQMILKRDRVNILGQMGIGMLADISMEAEREMESTYTQMETK